MLMRVHATFRNVLIKETILPGEYGTAAKGVPVSDWTTIRPIADLRANAAFSSATSALAPHETLHWPSYERAARDVVMLLWSADSDPQTSSYARRKLAERAHETPGPAADATQRPLL